MPAKRYSLITENTDCLDFASLAEAFEIGKQTPGACMVFDNRAQTGEIESWILQDGKWLANGICNMDYPDKIFS